MDQLYFFFEPYALIPKIPSSQALCFTPFSWPCVGSVRDLAKRSLGVRAIQHDGIMEQEHVYQSTCGQCVKEE